MKKIVQIFIFGILVCSCSSTKVEQKKLKYYNENGIEISRPEFNEILSTNNFLEIPGDSVNEKRLIYRENRGIIADRSILESLLETEIGKEIDSNKPIVIIYYPGKDRCNSRSSSDRNWIKNWHNELKNGLNQIAKVDPIFIYKDNNGLDKYSGIVNWKKDPEGIIENHFFKHHYPCLSFVVISKEGKYISFFGEFSKEHVWETTQLIYE
ncbi:hypothetical protein [Winogradskyella schleiferi]|uniref:hypothetical protein n=1 Tax=Winogradskyella schleiferi TaxID=2686078 RepID=UPI0015BFB6DB|nr:hypothetical protein [Winogradskyella schleiferi]